MLQLLSSKFVCFCFILVVIVSFSDCRRQQIRSIKKVNEKNTAVPVGFKSQVPLFSSDDETLVPIVQREKPEFAFPGGKSLNFRSNRISKAKKKINALPELKNIFIEPANVTTSVNNKPHELVKNELHIFETPFGFVGSSEINTTIPVQVLTDLNSTLTKPQVLPAGTVIAVSNPPILSPGTTVVTAISNNKPALTPGTIIATGDRRSITPGTVLSEPTLAPGTIIGISSQSNPQTPLPGTILGSSPSPSVKPNISRPLAPLPGTVLGVSTKPAISENISNIARRSRSSRQDEPQLPLPPLSNSAFMKPSKIDDLEEDIANSLTFDPSYTGPKITIDSPISVEYVRDTLVPFFKSGKLLDRKSSYSVPFYTFFFIFFIFIFSYCTEPFLSLKRRTIYMKFR